MKKPKKPTKAPGSDYEVGYGKPPEHTRFQPGHSGNPRGRPKGTNNLKTDLLEELGENIHVREGEQSRWVSKQRAVVKTIVARTLKGDARAATLVTSMMMRLLETGEGAPEVAEPLDDDEHEILQAFEDRVRRADERHTADEEERDDDSEGSS